MKEKSIISNAIVHEGYNSLTLENDIALLELTEPINFTNAVPIELISKDDSISGATDPGVMSWLTGWGLTNVIPNTYPTILQKVQLPIISNAQARTVWPNIPKSDIMAGYLNGNKDACMGDSGGPLVVPVSGGYKLAGIVSWGSSRCDTYGAYTRVSIFENWIEKNTGISIGYKPPSPKGDTIICKGVESSKYSIVNLATASAYEWKVLPEDAGIISGNSESATLYWRPGYDGLVTVMLRVTINNKVSDWASLKVKVIKTTKLLSQSDDVEMCTGKSINLNVEAEGYNLNYKWFQNDNLIQSGTSGQMNISSTNTYDSGNYTTEISGSCGIVFSNIIRLIVHPLTRITNISPDITVPYGDNATLEVKVRTIRRLFSGQQFPVTNLM